MIPEGSMIRRCIGEFCETPQVRFKVKRDLNFFTSSFGNPLSQNKNHSNSHDRFILQKKKNAMYVFVTLSIKYEIVAAAAVTVAVFQPLRTE